MSAKILLTGAIMACLAWAAPAQAEQALEAISGGSGNDRIVNETAAKPKIDTHQGVPPVSDADMVLPATNTLECDGKDYEVSTGDNKGDCTVNDEGKMECWTKTKKGGSSAMVASADCKTGCGSTAAGGSCKVKRH